MSDINVDDFFQDAARVLISLYQVFPRRKTVFVEDISGAEEPDEFGMYSNRYLACYSTLLWLAEEGYLRYEEPIHQEAIDQAVLTGRCFTLLASPLPGKEVDEDLPDSVKLERSSSIFQLRAALKARSSAQLRYAMLELFQLMQGTPATLNGLHTGSG